MLKIEKSTDTETQVPLKKNYEPFLNEMIKNAKTESRRRQ